MDEKHTVIAANRPHGDPVIGPGTYVRDDHGQDQHHRPETADAAPLVGVVGDAGLHWSPVLGIAATYLLLQRRRHLGHQHPHRLGLRHRQLRLVDRYRPRGNVDFSDPAAAEAVVAQLDQPLRRSDDAVRRHVRRHVPGAAHGPSVAGLLVVPLSEHDELWPQFRSPLVWDVFAVSTYFTISLVFWYIGLVPDLATLRDRAQNDVAAIIYGMLSLGWRGSARHWHRYEKAYLLLPAWRRRWCSLCTRSCPSISPSASCPGGIPRSSRRTSWRAPSIPDSPWCWCWRFRFAPSTTCTT